MIKNLVASCLLAANVNSAPINRDNNTYQTPYVVNTQMLNQQTNGYSGAPLYTTAVKTSVYNYTDNLRIDAVMYYQDTNYMFSTPNNPQTTLAYKDDINDTTIFNGASSMALAIIKITPTANHNLINNTLTWKINTGYLVKYTDYETAITREILQTTRSLENYMNMTINDISWTDDATTAPQKYLSYHYLNLKNVNNGYQTNIKTDNRQTPYQLANTIDIQNTLTIQPNKTNYYAIFLQGKYARNEGITSSLRPDGQCLSNNMNTIIQGNYLTISGTNVIVSGTTEIVDIPGTMIEVVGMPFTFISTAFNLTLFPGTPYEINISMLFLTIFAILSFVFVLKIFLRMKG